MLVLNKISVFKKIGFISFFVLIFQSSFALNSTVQQKDSTKLVEYKGKVISRKTKKPLSLATLLINNTNISTITNKNGKYKLKVPENLITNNITISYLGYVSQTISLNNLKQNDAIIKLEAHTVVLSEVKIYSNDASSLVAEVLRKKGENYANYLSNMVAFYRETIKKRRTYISLSEAVVGINKQSYTNYRNDIIKLYKARKSVNYNKLDTIAFKLKGGAYSNLYIDIIKNDNSFFKNDMFTIYNFTFDTPTNIDNRSVYVVNFKQKPEINFPYYYGKLYIDTKSLAIISAKFHLNLDNKIKARSFFVVKKPKNAIVTPIETTYQVNYREKDGKWYFGYSIIQLGFKINWDKKLFNTIYRTSSEIAITDWYKNKDNKYFKPKDRLKPSVIMSDKVSGFSNPNFWGAYNIIEPEKSIENAIIKINKQLKKIKD
jgi:CarboxypepD_reg-like domain